MWPAGPEKLWLKLADEKNCPPLVSGKKVDFYLIKIFRDQRVSRSESERPRHDELEDTVEEGEAHGHPSLHAVKVKFWKTLKKWDRNLESNKVF